MFHVSGKVLGLGFISQDGGLSSLAFGTDAAHEVFHAVEPESGWIFHHRYDCVVKAECLVARRAVEMTVHLLRGAFMVIMAETVFFLAAPVFYLVHKMVFGKICQRPENGASVHALKRRLDIVDAECVMKSRYGTAYQNPYGCGPYSMSFQQLFDWVAMLSCIHYIANLSKKR